MPQPYTKIIKGPGGMPMDDPDNPSFARQHYEELARKQHEEELARQKIKADLLKKPKKEY